MPKPEYAVVPCDILKQFMIDVFMRYDVPEEDARICADLLITSDKRGIDSHGISRFKTIYLDRIKTGQINPKTHFEVVRETMTTAVVDGHNGMGHVIGKKAMTMTIEKAKKTGMGMIAVRHSNHYGIAGYYALMAIRENMIGITGTNARPSVAPTFGVEPMMGTNPLTFGIPTDEDFPFVLDCATSLAQRGKIELAARLGKPVPEGWIINQEGKTETDAELILKELVAGTAALVPLGGIGMESSGHKGYGYTAVVEILSAALQGGAFLKMLNGLDEQKNPQKYNLGHFFMAIDIAAFTEPAEFKKTAGDICRALRNSRRAPGEDRIYTAGEVEYETQRERERKGIPVDTVLQKQLIALRDENGLTQYKFPFE